MAASIDDFTILWKSTLSIFLHQAEDGTPRSVELDGFGLYFFSTHCGLLESPSYVTLYSPNAHSILLLSVFSLAWYYY